MTDVEVEQMYLNLCDRSNQQHTLLVIYAPWCPHCRDIEKEVRGGGGGGAWASELVCVHVCVYGDA